MKKHALTCALLAALLLTACGGPQEDSAQQTPPAGPQQALTEPEPVETQPPPAEADLSQSGVTAAFCFGDFRLRVSNVCDIRSESMTDDGGTPHDYKVFVCCPGAKLTVLNADMEDGAYAEDGRPHARYGLITAPEGDRLRITGEMEGTSVDVAGIKGVAHLEASLYLLLFESRETPAAPSGGPYDVNGDGALQAWEFPVPTGETFGLTGEDAVLYTAVSQAKASEIIPRVSGGDTMLMLSSLRVLGEYDGENGEKNYVCGCGTQYYYDLGGGLADPRNPKYSSSGGGGNTARVTLAADGTLLDIQETYDGADNRPRIRELCGPLTDLAAAINEGADIPGRPLTPAGSELLRAYLDFYFPAEA